MPMHKSLLMVGLVVALWCGAAGTAVAGWERYKAGTLAEVMTGHDLLSGPQSANVLPGFPVKATVIYLGEQRPLSEPHKRLLGQWSNLRGKKTSIAPLFRTEILVEEAGTRYWMPVQNPLLPFIAREVGVGTAFRVLALWIGTIADDAVFIVNEFETGDNKLPGAE